MLEWKDASSYSRSDKERIPTVWELKIEGLRIVIHRIIHCPGWHISCYDLNIEDEYLYTEDLEEAKAKGLDLVVKNIEKFMKVREVILSKSK